MVIVQECLLQERQTKKIMNKFVLLIFVSTFLISCQSVKDGLTGVKRNNSDEFLIEKKNPLTEPPEYGKLPTPENKNEIQKNTSSNEIEELLKKNGFPKITTEIQKFKNFYYAEEYHQQYLLKNPNGYCGIGGCNVRFNN